MSTSPPDPSVAVLFALLWNGLSDILGVAATATLLRRAHKRAVVSCPALADLSIRRDGLAYRYDLPADWEQATHGPPLAALQALVAALFPLLIEMTGHVVVRRLARIEALRRAGLASGEEVGE